MILDHAKHAEAKKAAGKERKDTALTRICLRKAAERIEKTPVLTEAVLSAGYTSNDLLRWLADEMPEVKFPGEGDGECCCWAWPCNLVIPEKAKGQTWQVIVSGPRGCLYAVDFKLTEAGVEIVGEPVEVVSKDHYIVCSEIMDESDDEANGRTAGNRATREFKTDRKYRIFELTPEQADEKDYTIPVSFASEQPGIQRCDPFGMGRSDCERAAGIESGDSYIEILNHDDGNVDFSTLNNDGAVLDEHDEKDHIGVVKKGSAHLDRSVKVSRCVLRMDDSSEKGKMRFRQMKNGIRPNLSAGYKHTKFIKKETLPDGQTAYHFATKMLEVSSVAVPMDDKIGVGRMAGVGRVFRSLAELPRVDLENKARSSETTPDTKVKSMTPEEIAAQKAAEQAKIDAAVAKERAETEARVRAEVETKMRAEVTSATGLSETKERKRCQDITIASNALIDARPDLGKEIRRLAEECLKDNVSEQDFKQRVFTGPFKAAPATVNTMESLGYDEQDKKRYSLKRAIQNIVTRAQTAQGITEPDKDTLEGDVSIKLRKAIGPTMSRCQGFGNGFLVPHDAPVSPRSVTRKQFARMQRDATMQATLFGQGGATVATEVHLPIVDILRNEMVTTKLGVTSMAGLEGNIVIPRQAAAATAYSVPEIGNLTLSGQILDQIPLSPHRAGAWAQYSKQFLLQSTLDVENFIRTDLFAVIALYWDEMILNGQGSGDQPTGILNTPGVLLVNGTGNFTGYSGDNNAPSWADIVNFDTQINKVNGRRMGRGWATTSNARGRLETLAKLLVGATTVPSEALWNAMEMDVDEFNLGKMKGYPAVDSQQIPNDYLMLGVWAMNVIHALWGGLDIVVDPYTGAGQGIVKIFMNTWGDVALRHPQEFCISLSPASA